MTKLLLENKVAIITGASRGVGAAVAKRYAKEGAHVILVARTVGGLEEVDDTIKSHGGQATLVPLDLEEFDKIDQLGGIIAERFGKLDILVGNAGILGELTPVGHIAPSVWEKTFAVNVTANYRLLRSFDPLLRLSEAGRAIFVSSGITKANFPFWGAYAASKAALEQMVSTYAQEVRQTAIRANVVDPGIVRTKMRQLAMPGEDASGLPSPDEITQIFVNLVSDELAETGEIFKATVA